MRKLIAAPILLIILGGAAFWWLTEPQPAVPRDGFAAIEAGGDASRGRIVFDAGGCAGCHATPDQDDRLKLGGGRALKTPFGTFYVPNISPDPKDGIGGWKVGDLANALLSGVSPGGTHYYPAFPYTTYAHARLDDVRDLMAFLRTLQPIPGRPPPHVLAFPFNIRRGIGLWKRLYLARTPIPPDPSRSDEWNRGHYLAEALGHCAECHSPRNPLGAVVEAQRYAGGPDIEGNGWVPNITPGPDGISSWTKDDVVEVLTSGQTPDYDEVGSSMVEVVKNTSDLPDSDRAAIAEFIKSLPPRQGPPKPPKKQE